MSIDLAIDMRKIICLFIMLTSMAAYSFPTLEGNVFSVQSTEWGCQCYLCFPTDNEYYIELDSRDGDDQIFVLMLSEGKYEMNGKALTTTDDFYGFTMRFLLEGETLKVINSFPFLQNKVFTLDYFNSWEVPVHISCSYNQIKEERESYNISHPKDFIFSSGKYVSSFGHSVELFEDNSFKVEYKGCLLSQGEWKRNKNEIQLFDPLNPNSYFLLINECGLESKFLPGDCKGFALKKVVKRPSTPIVTKKKGWGCSRK